MAWIRHRLRDAEVYARVDAQGQLVTDPGGRVEVIYKAEPGAKVYRAAARNLSNPTGEAVEVEAGEPAPEKPVANAGAKPKPSGAAAAAAAPPNAIHVWTDGACTGNPGPAGLGVVIIEDGKHRELSEYLGQGTNNIAELTAILRGLEEVPDRTRPVLVYSDSQYSIDMITKPWKAKANAELIDRLRKLSKQFTNLQFVKVAGHAGIVLNERVDQLATGAVARRA